MSRLFRKYCCCSVFCLILVFILYLRIRGYNFGVVVIDSDEFLAVAYITDDDDGASNEMRYWNESQLLNLTNFRYTLQPTNAVCSNEDEEYLGVC